MSIRSLLQLILFFLIIIIIGGTYFLYFYSGPMSKNKSENKISKNVSKFENNLKNQTDDAILEENINEKKIVNKNTLSKKNERDDYNIDNNLKKGENLTKKIEYVTTNKRGDILKIFADFGKSNIKNSDILNLEGVAGVFSSFDKSQIKITSEFAEYNYKNQNSKFFKNVKINYDNRVINCENLNLNISKNIAVAYNNVIIKDGESVMKAQKITMNILTKDISINSNEKIKVLKN